jgi:hypothetical protein
MSIAEADRVYWSEKKHSREDAWEYQRRQDRLNEIRLEMMTLMPFTIQWPLVGNEPATSGLFGLGELSHVSP